MITFFIPSYAITLLCLIGLFSPSTAKQERVERCSMGMNAMLNMSVILLMISTMMPKSADDFPKLGTVNTRV